MSAEIRALNRVASTSNWYSGDGLSASRMPADSHRYDYPAAHRLTPALARSHATLSELVELLGEALHATLGVAARTIGRLGALRYRVPPSGGLG
jgi:hypothetical protein